VQVAGAAWRVAMRTVAGVRDLVQRTGYGHIGRVLGGRAVGWRRVQSAPGPWRLGARVSWLSLKTRGDGFLQFGLKIGGDGFSQFSLKTSGRFLDGASKPLLWRFLRFGPQNR
jgi:hypothetical protein